MWSGSATSIEITWKGREGFSQGLEGFDQLVLATDVLAEDPVAGPAAAVECGKLWGIMLVLDSHDSSEITIHGLVVVFLVLLAPAIFFQERLVPQRATGQHH